MVDDRFYAEYVQINVPERNSFVSLLLTGIFFTIGLIKDLKFLRAAKEQK